MGMSNAERQAALAARRREAGLIPMTVWVRKDRKAELMAFAATLTEPSPAPKPQPVTATPQPAADPRQLDLEAMICAKAAGDQRAGEASSASQADDQAVDADTTKAARIRFGAAVRAARLAKGYRHVKDFAPVVGLSRSALNNIEVGKFGTSPEKRAKLIEALGLSGPI